MLGGTLILYFFVLFTALIVVGSDGLGTPEIIAISAVGALGLIVVRSWNEMLGTDDSDEAQRDREEAPVPLRIRSYLADHHVRWTERHHAPAATAQELAQALHRSGHTVAKVVMVLADGTPWMVVLPASERIDFDALRAVLHVQNVEMMRERDAARLFPDCEIGAEPPFGRLYRVPTLVERDLVERADIAFHGGTHGDSIEVPSYEYERMERPLIAHVASALH